MRVVLPAFCDTRAPSPCAGPCPRSGARCRLGRAPCARAVRRTTERAPRGRELRYVAFHAGLRRYARCLAFRAARCCSSRDRERDQTRDERPKPPRQREGDSGEYREHIEARSRQLGVVSIELTSCGVSIGASSLMSAPGSTQSSGGSIRASIPACSDSR